MKTSQQLVTEVRSRIREITVADLAAKLEQSPELVLIDVREPAEFQQGHIRGAVNMPRGVLEMQIHNHPKVAALNCDTDLALAELAKQPVYLICRSGGRSALAAESLMNMGFPQVISIAEGMADWLAQKRPVVS